MFFILPLLHLLKIVLIILIDLGLGSLEHLVASWFVFLPILLLTFLRAVPGFSASGGACFQGGHGIIAMRTNSNDVNWHDDDVYLLMVQMSIISKEILIIHVFRIG